jgi:hypothetical protein
MGTEDDQIRERMNLVDSRMLAQALRQRVESGLLAQRQVECEVLYLADITQGLVRQDWLSRTRFAIARSLVLLNRPHHAMEQIESATWHSSARGADE